MKQKKQVNLKICELIVHATNKLREIEGSIADLFEETEAELVASIDDKKQNWMNVDRMLEKEALVNDVFLILNGSVQNYEKTTDIFTKVKSYHETIANVEQQPKPDLKVQVAYITHCISSFSCSVRNLRWNNSTGYHPSTLKNPMEDRICKLISNGSLKDFKEVVDKFPSNLRQYLVNGKTYVKQAIRECQFEFVRYFVDDCHISVTEDLFSNIRSLESNIQLAEVIAEYLVNKNPNLATSLLYKSVDLNSLKLCRLALEKFNVNIDEPQPDHEKAIFEAVERKKWDVFLFLLKKGARVDNGNIYEVEDQNQDPDLENRMMVGGSNILHVALCKRKPRLEFVEQCLYQNPDFLYERNEKNETPVEVAFKMSSSRKEKKWMKLLFPKVPNFLHILNKSNINGAMKRRRQWQIGEEYTFKTLSKAIEISNSESFYDVKNIEWLDWTAQDPKTGVTLLHVAAKNGNHGVIYFLVQHVDVNCQTLTGQTALHLASFWGHPKVVRDLKLKYGADLKILDKNGKSALDWCNEGARCGRRYAADVRTILTSTIKCIRVCGSEGSFDEFHDECERMYSSDENPFSCDYDPYADVDSGSD